MKRDRVIELCQVGCRKRTERRGKTRIQKRSVRKEREKRKEKVEEVAPLKLPRN